MTEQNRLKDNSFDRLPIGDVPHLKKLVEAYRNNPKLDTEWFFSFALLGFYDAMWGGLKETAGHIIYRLSDAIEKPQREIMAIYPSSKGSMIVDENQWASLEDWRKEWESINPVIPDYTKRLSEGFSLKKPKNTPK